KHNAIYVATQTNKVYAFDADSGISLWPMRDFATYAIPEYPVPSPNADIGNRYCAVNHSPMIGITSTPVIDLTSNTIYVEAFSGHTPGGGRIPPGNVDYPNGAAICQSTYTNVFSHRLHAIDITTGLEKFGGPIHLSAQAAGTADGGSVVFFNDAPQLQRPALLLQNSTIYLGFGSFADTDPYHGWVVGVPANFAGAGGNFPAFVTTPNSHEGGIWQAGHGLAGDAAGSVYAMTGNGTNHVEPYYAESFVKLPASLGNRPSAFYREPNVDSMDAADSDLGSSGPILLAGPAGFSGSNLLLGGGKEGFIYTINTTNMSLIQKFSATYEPDAGTTLKNGGSCPRTFAPSHIHGAPAYWNGPVGSRIYVWGERDYIKAFQLDANGRVATAGNALAPSWCGPAGQTSSQCGALADVGTTIGAGGCGMPGGSIVISSNGPLGGTGIVWAHHQKADSCTNPYVGATLFALDATDLNKELWDSDMSAADNLSYNAKGVPPVVANGRVYMATFDAQRTTGQAPVVTGRVRVYGLKQNNR
ncbi:MAG TPA: hypothetical protein VGY54_17490, partial [Polyangiaceae bacterium]|nr:hypothetical protein [Polyangiaceae bacterium]